MRTHRFFAPAPLEPGQICQLPKEAAHHCIQVLRYSVDDSLILFNGDGFEYNATIQSISGKDCFVHVNDRVDPGSESPLKIHLIQGIARGDKMDFIIQKSVELGVAKITPLFTERCNVKLDGKRLIKKQKHWQNIAISAAEQSGRAIIPAINPPTYLSKLSLDSDVLEWHRTEADTLAQLYLEPAAEESLGTVSRTEHLHLFIGPEGGFSKSDLGVLNSIGAKGVKLGPRILRTETAGLASIAILQTQFGDL